MIKRRIKMQQGYQCFNNILYDLDRKMLEFKLKKSKIKTLNKKRKNKIKKKAKMQINKNLMNNNKRINKGIKTIWIIEKIRKITMTMIITLTKMMITTMTMKMTTTLVMTTISMTKTLKQ